MSAGCPACTSGVRGVHHSTDCQKVQAPTFVCVSVYDRPDGRRVVHVYSGPEGTGYSTRARAQGANVRSLRGMRERHGDEFIDEALSSKRLSLHVTNVIAL